MVPDFRTVLRFSDLHVKPINMDLQKRVRYQATLWHLRNKIVVHSNYNHDMIKRYMKRLFDERRKEKLGNLKKELER